MLCNIRDGPVCHQLTNLHQCIAPVRRHKTPRHSIAEIENKLSKLYLQEGKHHQRPLSRCTLKCEIQCHELISETAEKCRNENVDKKVDLRTGRGKE